MPKLLLKFGDKVLKEIALTHGVVTIGRAPDCLLQIDNPAVSSRHAKVYWENGTYFIQDLKSSNGTFLNTRPVQKSALKDGDSLLIGKHAVEFREHSEISAEQKKMVDRSAHWQSEIEKKPQQVHVEPTHRMDTQQARDFIAAKAKAAGISDSSLVPERTIALLTVRSGKTDKPEYVLSGRICAIGKSEMATVRLRGWLAPDMAATISRHENKFVLSPAATRVQIVINGKPALPQHELQNGDVIEVAGVQIVFRTAPA